MESSVKRSNMVSAIATFIRSYNECSYEYSKFQADKILKGMEELGIFPPTIKNPELPDNMDTWKHATERALDELYNRSKPIGPFEVNEWETE